MKKIALVFALTLLLMIAIPVSGQGDVLLEDDFSDPGTGWEANDYETGDVGYANGSYFVTSEGGGSIMWGVAPANFLNTTITITVEATPVVTPNNDNNGYGIMCHVQEDLTSGYIMFISSDGYASISVAEGSDITTLYEWATSPAILLGNETNEIQAVCGEGPLQLLANGELVAEVIDTTFTSGGIALTAVSYEESELTEVQFDNIVVFSEDAVPPSTGGKGSSSGTSTTPTEAPPEGSLLNDDFSSTASNWEIGEYDSGAIGYGDGYYYVTSEGDGDIMWGVAEPLFGSNISITVEATQVSASSNDNNGYGIMCNILPESATSGYLLFISGDGYATILMGDDSGITRLTEWTESSAINLGNATNELQAICADGTLQLYVNGELAAETFDTTYEGGRIGLAAVSYEDAASTEIHFDNMLVTGDDAPAAPASGGKQ